jgi:hypothetical protein
MKTHISEIEKEQKNGNQTDVQLLKDTRNIDTLIAVPGPSSRGVSQQTEHISQTSAKMDNSGSISTGSCFICDPDWCPEHKKKMCAGKRLVQQT